MKILEILGNEKTKAGKKLEAVTNLVDKVRGKYGNSDVEITAVKVNSTLGMVSINLLTTAEKVAVAEQDIRKCIVDATAITEHTEGALFDRSFEALVATSPLLTNLGIASDSEY